MFSGDPIRERDSEEVVNESCHTENYQLDEDSDEALEEEEFVYMQQNQMKSKFSA